MKSKMTSQTLINIPSPYRTARRAAIASGIIGIVAVGFLITFLATRDKNLYAAITMLRIHDASVAIQFILMIPVIFGLRQLSQGTSRDMSRLRAFPHCIAIVSCHHQICFGRAIHVSPRSIWCLVNCRQLANGGDISNVAQVVWNDCWPRPGTRRHLLNQLCHFRQHHHSPRTSGVSRRAWKNPFYTGKPDLASNSLDRIADRRLHSSVLDAADRS